MSTLAPEKKEPTLTDALALDLDPIVSELADEETREISSNAFARYLWDHFGYTVEFARSLIYALIDLGRLVLTERFTLRVPA